MTSQALTEMAFVFSLIPPVWLTSSKSWNQSRTSQGLTADYWPMCQCFNNNSVRWSKELNLYWSPSTVLPHESQGEESFIRVQKCVQVMSKWQSQVASPCNVLAEAALEAYCSSVILPQTFKVEGFKANFLPACMEFTRSLYISDFSAWYPWFLQVQRHALQDELHTASVQLCPAPRPVCALHCVPLG